MTTGSTPVAPACVTINQLLGQLLDHQAAAFNNDEHVDACELVDFMSAWRPQALAALAHARPADCAVA